MIHQSHGQVLSDPCSILNLSLLFKNQETLVYLKKSDDVSTLSLHSHMDIVARVDQQQPI